MLQIFCLGTPRLLLSTVTAPLALTPKALALFVYLAATAAKGEPALSRDTLADLLWSEVNNQQARTNLRYLLPELRRKVDDYLVITPKTIAFHRQAPYWLDVEQLRATLTARLETIATPTLQAALDLYQGEFLAGFAVRNVPIFEAWVTQQREELHTLVVQSGYTLVERYWQRADYQLGLAAVQRLLQWEPWHEAGHRLLMQLLAVSGQRTAALAHYERCRTILADELGVAPEAATTALYAQIRDGAYDRVAGDKVTDDKVTDDKVTGDKVTGDKVTGDKVTARVPPGRAVTLSPPHPVILTGQALSPPPFHNLPSQLTPFFGREREIEQLHTLLLGEGCRLLTLVGEGGIGKTRLALAVAQAILDFGGDPPGAILASADPSPSDDQNPKSKIKNQKFPDGIWWVGLAGITATAQIQEQLAMAIAQATGLSFGGTQPLLTQLLAQLHTKTLLLLCDNAEHLLPGLADFLLVLLQECPRITALVTSRHLLNLQAEFVWRVPGLPVPPHNDLTTLTPPDLTLYSSIMLFVERAKRLNRDFQLTAANGPALAAICRLVEGLPLAIELAAALTKQYSCAELYTALERDYTILATTFVDLSPRHRSIQAMLDYSWRFLRADEARTLAGCSVFLGGFTIAAAMAVTGATSAQLTRLVDYSLLQVHEGRFSMHDLVRHYAAAQLVQFPPENQALLARHAAYYMALVHGLEAMLLSTFAAQHVVQSELDNVRTAWLWSAAQNHLDLLAMGVESLQSFYRLAGLHREAIYLLETALASVRRNLIAFADLAAPAARPAQQLLAQLLCHTAQFYRWIGEVETGERLAQEALLVGQQVTDPALQGLAYHELARLAQVRSDFPTMHMLAEQGCAQARLAGLPQLIAECFNDLGIAVSSCMHPQFAIPHFHEALRCLQGATNRYLEARVLGNLGFFHLSCHEYHLACRYLPQTLALQRQLQDRESSMISQIFLGDLWMAIGLYEQAQQEYEQVLTLVQMIHNPYWKSWLYISYSHLQYLRSDLIAAHNACSAAQQIVQQGKSHVQVQWLLIELGYILADQGDWPAARHSYEQALALQARADWTYRTAEAHAGLATLLLVQGEVAAALIQVEAALTHLQQQGVAVAKEPFRIYWACVRVLQAVGDPRAVTVLRTAVQLLQGIADELTDAMMRHAFLETVTVNRQLLAAARAAGIN